MAGWTKQQAGYNDYEIVHVLPAANRQGIEHSTEIMVALGQQLFRAGRRSGLGEGRRRLYGQDEGYGRALTRTGLDFHFPAVCLGDPTHYGEAEAGPFGFSGA